MIRKLLKTFFISSVLGVGISIGTSTSAMHNIPFDKIAEYINKTASVLASTEKLSVGEILEEAVNKISVEKEVPNSIYGKAEAMACLIALFLSEELRKDLFFSWECNGHLNALFDIYKAPEEKIRYLNDWVNTKIKPNSKDQNSINIYAILTRRSSKK